MNLSTIIIKDVGWNQPLKRNSRNLNKKIVIYYQSKQLIVPSMRTGSLKAKGHLRLTYFTWSDKE